MLWIAGRYPGCSQAMLHLVLNCSGCCEPGPVDEDDRRALERSHLSAATLGPLVWSILFYGHPRLALGLEHLCRQCDECWELAEPLFRSEQRERSPDEAIELVERFEYLLAGEQKTLTRERAEAPRRLEQLLAQPTERRRLMVRNSSTFRSAALVDMLCELARRTAPREGREALELGNLAEEMAGLLDETTYGKRVIEDLHAIAHAVQANALRLLHHLEAAEASFARARKHQQRGTGLIAIAAEIDALEASMCATRRSFAKARQLLAAARTAFAELRHEAGLVRVLLKDAHVCRESGEPESAARLFDEALPLLDPDSQPRLLLCARHGQLAVAVDLEDFGHAARLLPAVRELSTALGNDMDLLRLRWIEGEIAAGMDHLPLAAAIFTDVRDDLLARGLFIDAGLVSLHLGRVYLRQGRLTGLRELLEETLRFFAEHEIQREAREAFELLTEAALTERITETLLLRSFDTLKSVGASHAAGGG